MSTIPCWIRGLPAKSYSGSPKTSMSSVPAFMQGEFLKAYMGALQFQQI